MYIQFELAIPVHNAELNPQSADKIKEDIISNIRKMGYEPEKFKISVDQVEVDDKFIVPVKVYRVSMSSKEKLRILRYRISKTDVDTLLNVKKRLEQWKYDKTMGIEAILTQIITKIQNRLKKRGFVTANMVKQEDGGYTLVAVFNPEVAEAENRGHEVEDPLKTENVWNFLVEDIKKRMSGKAEEARDLKEEVSAISEVGSESGEKVLGGGWGRRGWRHRGWGHRGWFPGSGYFGCYPTYWSGCRYYGGVEKVPVDIEAKFSLEFSNKNASFKTEATGLPLALDIIVEAEEEYRKVLETKELSVLVVKFSPRQDMFAKGYQPVSFDVDTVKFDEKMNSYVSRITVPADSGVQTYVYYLFVKSRDLKDFDREPEAVKDKLKLKLRSSAAVGEDMTPI